VCAFLRLEIRDLGRGREQAPARRPQFAILIKDSSFRIGDSKFTLSAAGAAQIRTALTDPVTGNTNLITGDAAQG
jgi:hypothetical protein